MKRTHGSKKEIAVEIRKCFEVKITKIWHIKICRVQQKLVLEEQLIALYVYIRKKCRTKDPFTFFKKLEKAE